jgi:hypothetical protein
MGPGEDRRMAKMMNGMNGKQITNPTKEAMMEIRRRTI